MSYSYQRPALFMQYSPKRETLLVCYETSIQAWDPFENILLYHISNAHAGHGIEPTLTSYKITSLKMNETKGRFVTGATNGTIRIRQTATGQVINEIRMQDHEDSEALRGCVAVRFVEEHNCQVYMAGNLQHVVQIDLFYHSRLVWNERVSPIYLGAIHPKILMLVTLHDNGDLIFWKMAYRKKWSHFNVLDPERQRRKDVHGMLLDENPPDEEPEDGEGAGGKTTGHQARSSRRKSEGERRSSVLNPKEVAEPEHKHKDDATPPLFVAVIVLTKSRNVFLSESIGNVLLVESCSEFVQCWNMYGFVDKFRTTRDLKRIGFVTCATVDDSERFLFLGSEVGFLRVFHIEAYCNPGLPPTLSRVQLRLLFPYLWKSLHRCGSDRKADRDTRVGKKGALLVNCYRAHPGAITSVVYVEPKQLLFTAGTDHQIRVWHLSGSYIGSLGVSADMYHIPRNDPPPLHTPPPPYKVPSFIDTPYEKTMGLCSRKVFLREWRDRENLSSVNVPKNWDRHVTFSLSEKEGQAAGGDGPAPDSRPCRFTPHEMKHLSDIFFRMRMMMNFKKDLDNREVGERHLDTIGKYLDTLTLEN